MRNIISTKEWYDKVFPDEKSKAEAFDKIADLYYHTNFATTSKSEIDLLMFSEYIERLYVINNDAAVNYSDYNISRILGITQNRVRSLKEKKELKYPGEFDIEKAFIEVLPRVAPAPGDKVAIYINDVRLYLELKNLIEELGGYSENTLTPKLLLVSVPFFVDLMVYVNNSATKNEMKKKLQEILEKNSVNAEDYLNEGKTIFELFKDKSLDIERDVLVELLKEIPVIGGAVGVASKEIIDILIKKYTK